MRLERREEASSGSTKRPSLVGPHIMVPNRVILDIIVDGATANYATNDLRELRSRGTEPRQPSRASSLSSASLLASRPPFARPQYNPDAAIAFVHVNL